MKTVRVKLFDGEITTTQQLIVAFWALLLLAVLGLWVAGSASLLSAGLSAALLSIGRLLGLLATFFALTQFMLMGRVAWIERSFGLDRLASYHRLNGYLAITCIVIHPLFIIESYAISSGMNYGAQYLETVLHQPYVWLALIAELLFVGVVISSIRIARKHLKFEQWYYVHMMVYLAIIIVPFHQFVSSPELAGSTFGRTFWLSLYSFVALNILIWRFGIIGYNYQKYTFHVKRIVAETPTTTSVYIGATNLARLRFLPGQFVLVRILSAGMWWQEHPFSVSAIPRDNELRLTIRRLGDYTDNIAHLKVGAPVFIAGPFGRFTRQVARTDKRLYIAGGIGITPIRPLLEESIANKIDTKLLYANRNELDAPLKKEIDQLATASFVTVYYLYSEAVKNKNTTQGRIDGALIKKTIPDFLERDIYLCGPPPMMAAIITDLYANGVQPERLHYERFSLHTS